MTRTKIIIIRFTGVFLFLVGVFCARYLADLASEEKSFPQIYIYLSILFVVVGLLFFALVDKKATEALRRTIRVIKGKEKLEGRGIKIRIFGTIIALLGIILLIVWIIYFNNLGWESALKLIVLLYIGLGLYFVGILSRLTSLIVMRKESVRKIEVERKALEDKFTTKGTKN